MKGGTTYSYSEPLTSLNHCPHLSGTSDYEGFSIDLEIYLMLNQAQTDGSLDASASIGCKCR